MKISSVLILVVIVILTGNFQLLTAHAQGALTPPGAPAPTMRSLDQIYSKLEARTPISSAPFTITNPGSYYLTTNIVVTTAVSSNAIVITANGVTLDLNGFNVSSTVSGATGTAILLAGSNLDITILNGHILSGVTNNASGVFNGPGFANGIFYSGPSPQNIRLTGLTVSGCQIYGINIINFGISSATLVDSCTVQTAGSYGIVACVVTRSAAYNCGNYGIVADTASDCYGYANIANGVLTEGSANNCYGWCNGSGHGLYANIAIDCYGYSANGIGLYAYIANSCFGQSSTTSPSEEVTYKYNMP